MNRRLTFAALVAGLAIAPAALAQDAAPPAASASASAAATSGDAGSTAEEDKEADKGSDPNEKPEHKSARRNYIRKIKREMNAAVHAGGKALTDAEREVIRKHWHRAMRLWRIRHLASVDKDSATVKRVDDLIAKADKKALDALKDLNSKAPLAGTAPAASGGGK